MNEEKVLRRLYQKKFDVMKKSMIEIPVQGWIKTIRDFFGMTTMQFAKKLNISQPRIISMEKNENNVKISTMKKIADVLGCDFVYAFVPRENINDIMYKQARKKALNILTKVNRNMELENQREENNEIVEDLIQDILNANISRIWDED